MERREAIVWVAKCLNEWCAGPETIGVGEGVPPKTFPCPVCGWVAMLGDKPNSPGMGISVKRGRSQDTDPQ